MTALIFGLINSLTATDNTKFRFATDGEGNYGYLKADDSFVPFKSGYTYDNPRIQASGVLSASNITWVGGFSVSLDINLKHEDTHITFITNRAMTVNIDTTSYSHASGTYTYELDNNTSFNATLGGPTQGNQTCNYQYIIW